MSFVGYNVLQLTFLSNRVYECLQKRNISYYYMAVSHKDWELPNSGICLAEIDIDRGLDFPI